MKTLQLVVANTGHYGVTDGVNVFAFSTRDNAVIGQALIQASYDEGIETPFIPEPMNSDWKPEPDQQAN